MPADSCYISVCRFFSFIRIQRWQLRAASCSFRDQWGFFSNFCCLFRPSGYEIRDSYGYTVQGYWQKMSQEASLWHTEWSDLFFSGHQDGANLHILMNTFTFYILVLTLIRHLPHACARISWSEELCLFKSRDMNDCLRCSHLHCLPPKLGYCSQPYSWMV